MVWYNRPGPKSKIQNISDRSLQQVQWYIPEFVIELEHPVVDVDFIELHVADQVCEYVRHLEAGGGSGSGRRFKLLFAFMKQNILAIKSELFFKFHQFTYRLISVTKQALWFRSNKRRK